MIGLTFILGIALLFFFGRPGISESFREYRAGEKSLLILASEILLAGLVSFGVFLLSLTIYWGQRVYVFELPLGVFAVCFFSLWLISIGFRKVGGRWLFLSSVLRTGLLFVIPYILFLLEPLRKWFQVSIYY
jgi:hypothetical protein